jgi:hypothetical protein
LRSALGKARGAALRLALVLEMLWWCSEDTTAPPPRQIEARAFAAAATLVADYFVPMAERVYGDAAATQTERAAATLARWIFAKRPREVYVRDLQRTVRLPGCTGRIRSETQPTRWSKRIGFVRRRQAPSSANAAGSPTRSIRGGGR